MSRKKPVDQMSLKIESRSVNESFARVAVSAFAAQQDPTVEEISDIKTAVSEAVTNAIVHGYGEKLGVVEITAALRTDDVLEIAVADKGKGIADVAQAMQPFFTTQPEKERSGMGFSVMQTFMDKVDVASVPGEGTTVRMEKRLRSK